MTRWLFGGVFALIGVLGLLWVFRGVEDGRPDEAHFKRVKEGMSRAEVEELLGGPPFAQHVSFVSIGRGKISTATWSGPGHYLHVQFDEEGVVVRKQWDGTWP